MTTSPMSDASTALPLTTSAPRSRSRGRSAWRLVRRQPLAALFGVYLTAVAVVALAAPVIAPHSPGALAGARLLSPGSEFLLGTDELGRDVLSRMIYGARVSLIVGFGVVTLSTLVGGALGIVSAYFFGWIDNVIQRVMDALMAFPALVLVVALVAVLGRSVPNVVIAISIVTIPITQRVVRSAALVEMSQPYIDAARAIGGAGPRIMLRHLLPNVLVPMIIVASAGLGVAILTEAALSFLGLGVQPPTPSWGNMINASSRLFLFQAPWIAIFPGLAIMSVVLAFNFVGDAIRDELDPRLRSR